MTAAALARARTPGRVLFVTAWLPTEAAWTATAGIARRQRLLIDGLKALGVPTDVLVYVSEKRFDGSEAMRLRIERDLRDFWQWGADLRVDVCRWQPGPSRQGPWAHYVAPALDFLKHRHFARFTGAAQVAALDACLARDPGLVVAHRMQCMVPLLLTARPVPPVCFDLDDIEHVAFRRSILEPPVWTGKYLEFLQVPALKAGERRVVRAARATFVCSDADRRAVQRLAPDSRVEAIPNAVASRATTMPASDPVLLFLGHYSFTPNRLGIEHFLREVWPRVRAVRPDARMIVAGAGSESIRHDRSADDGVGFPGYVDDLDALYAGCRAVVCPILTGGGTRLKVMEAAAAARAVVSTSVGAEGIALRDGEEIFLADTPKAFADRCVALLDDPALAATMGLRARDTVERLYGRAQVVQRLAATFAGDGG